LPLQAPANPSAASILRQNYQNPEKHGSIDLPMKYVLFTVALAVGVPVMAGISSMSVKMKRLLFTLLIVSLMFGSKFSINIMSMEYYRGPVRGYEVTLADLIALGLVLGMLLRSGSKVVFFPRFFWIFLLFFIFSIINVAGSDYTIYGWFVIWQLFRMGMLYWCTVNFFATDDDGKGALDAVMWGYALTGLIMILTKVQDIRTGLRTVIQEKLCFSKLTSQPLPVVLKMLL